MKPLRMTRIRVLAATANIEEGETMAIHLKPVIAAIVVCTLQACAPPQTAENLAPKASTPVSGAVVLEDLTFPLPGGEWREVYTHSIPGSSPNAPQTFKVYASVSGAMIDRAAIFWVQRKFSVTNKWRQYQSCLTTKDSDVHYSEIILNEGSNTPSVDPKLDCWHVRALSTGRAGGAHPVIEALHLYAAREGLVMPAVMIGAKFAQKRIGDRRDYAEYLWNLDVLSPNQAKIWRPTDWTQSAVATDPARRIAVERITRWAKDWRKHLLSGGSS
jgi:hypothetical protein